jgi:hypothetical protein
VGRWLRDADLETLSALYELLTAQAHDFGIDPASLAGDHPVFLRYFERCFGEDGRAGDDAQPDEA